MTICIKAIYGWAVSTCSFQLFFIRLLHNRRSSPGTRLFSGMLHPMNKSSVGDLRDATTEWVTKHKISLATKKRNTKRHHSQTVQRWYIRLHISSDIEIRSIVWGLVIQYYFKLGLKANWCAWCDHIRLIRYWNFMVTSLKLTNTWTRLSKLVQNLFVLGYLCNFVVLQYTNMGLALCCCNLLEWRRQKSCQITGHIWGI